jgi:hypothetical protein
MEPAVGTAGRAGSSRRPTVREAAGSLGGEPQRRCGRNSRGSVRRGVTSALRLDQSIPGAARQPGAHGRRADRWSNRGAGSRLVWILTGCSTFLALRYDEAEDYPYELHGVVGGDRIHAHASVSFNPSTKQGLRDANLMTRRDALTAAGRVTVPGVGEVLLVNKTPFRRGAKLVLSTHDISGRSGAPLSGDVASSERYAETEVVSAHVTSAVGSRWGVASGDQSSLTRTGLAVDRCPRRRSSAARVAGGRSLDRRPPGGRDR